MPEFLDANLRPQLRAAQIHNSIRHIQLFLASILIIFLYVYCVYQFNFSHFSVYFNIWFFLTTCCVSLFWLVTALWFKSEQYQVSQAHRWVQFLCISVGSLIAIGIALIYYHLPQVNPNFEPVHALTLSALMLIVTQTLALTFLTQRLDYFCLIFIPSIIPYFVSQFILTDQINQLFHLTVNFVLIVILLCANSTARIHKRLSSLFLRNNQLIKTAEQQVAWTEDLCVQLKYEMDKSKEIELQLQQNNQLLEQKIKERTFDIEQMNLNLENQKQNLDLAHEIAGLKPWDWNIKERHISVNDYQQQKKRKHSKEHSIHLQNIIHPDDLLGFKTALKRHLRAETDRYEATYRVQQNTGEWTWVHDIGRVIERDPNNKKPLRMVGIQRDIHRERTDQERLKLAASVLEQAAEGIFILDKHLHYVNVNPFYEKITGFHKEDCLGQHLFAITANKKSHQQQVQHAILEQLERTGEYDGELTEKFRSGKELTLWLHINAIHDEHNRVINYIGIVSDLTERKLQEQRLSYLENYDTLTDLPNRFYYNYQLHQYLVSHQDSIQQLAVIRLNIDRFRPLNEFLSNNGGDELLRQVAQRLRLTNTDALFLAHLNGDDFAIVYEISHIRPSIQQHCERIQDAFAEPFDVFGQEHFITVSMGISFYPEHGRQLDYLNNCAEQALTEAKRLGGHTIKYYSSDNTALLEQGIYLERDLRQAIRNDELIVYYQPKINFKDQHIYGFEALVRWNHPSKGIIPPALFIPMAEKTSLISDIGRIVIRKTAEQISYWNSIGFKNICVSVNVVAQQLQRGQLLSDLDDAIQTYQISGESLELEITESSLIENSKNVKLLLDQIKQRNINIALDDFGTGYSSLAYLAEFPIDILKIDRAFIANIGDGKQDAIISAMVAMGKAMGLTVVAEGIETEQQLCYLETLQCDIAQGYLFSKPLSEKNATEYLQQHKLIPS